MDKDTAIKIAMGCVMSSMMDNETKKEVLDLIDAEISRQSVGDGEIEQLIDDLKNNAIVLIGDTGESDLTLRELNLAISALRAYRKPAPCEWCESDDITVQYDLAANLQSVDPTKRNYCPNCGGKLNEN